MSLPLTPSSPMPDSPYSHPRSPDPLRSGLAYRRYHEIDGKLPRRMLDRMLSVHGQEIVWRAAQDWDAPWYPTREELSPQPLFGQAFLGWMLFRWCPARPRTPGLDRHCWPFAHAYQDLHAAELSRDERSYIDGQLGRSWDLWIASHIDPGGRTELESFLTGERVTVADIATPEPRRVGAACFASVGQFEGQHFIHGSSRVPLPRSAVRSLLDARERVLGNARLEPIQATFVESALRLLYFHFADRVIAPFKRRGPGSEESSSTQPLREDLEPVEFISEVFELGLPAAVVSLALQSLSEIGGPSLAVAKSWPGPIRWAQACENAFGPCCGTTLASIEVNEDTLLIRTSSRRRARAARALVTRKLGGRLRLRRSESHSVEQILRLAVESVGLHRS